MEKAFKPQDRRLTKLNFYFYRGHAELYLSEKFMGSNLGPCEHKAITLSITSMRISHLEYILEILKLFMTRKLSQN